MIPIVITSILDVIAIIFIPTTLDRYISMKLLSAATTINHTVANYTTNIIHYNQSITSYLIQNCKTV